MYNSKEITDAVAKATPLTVVKDWRPLFDEKTLAEAEQLADSGQYTRFHYNDHEAEVVFTTTKTKSAWPAVRIGGAPEDLNEEWELEMMYCSKHPAKTPFRRSLSYYDYSSIFGNYHREEVPCVHKAALLILWEREHGEWRLTETENDIRYRLYKEALNKELERRGRLKDKEEKNKCSAAEILPPAEETDTVPFFDLRPAAEKLRTNRYRILRAKELYDVRAEKKTEDNSWYGIDRTDISLAFSGSGEQYIRADGNFREINERFEANILMTADGQIKCRCGCEDNIRPSKRELSGDTLCEHELVLLKDLYCYIAENDPGDATDKTAERFFEAFGEAAENGLLPSDEEVAEKTKNITLTPRIVMDGGSPSLSFKIGQRGGKQLILKNLRDMLDAWESGARLKLSKQVELDFSAGDFTDESMPWVTLIQRRVSETDDVNDRLSSRSRWGYYYHSPSIKVRNKEALSGSILDRFYDLAEGMNCEYQNKAASGSGSSLHIGHAPLRVGLSSMRISGPSGRFLGVEISGSMPVLLYGATDIYTIDDRALSRITKDEQTALLPFTKAADENGAIRFRVGKDRLAEFYYRVVPSLLENPIVRFEDNCAEEAEQQLPPEGTYTFHLDVAEGMILCRASAKYGEDGRERPIPAYEEDRKSYYDKLQEDRIQKAIKRFFEGFDAQRRIFGATDSEDKLFKIQTEAVPVLERYGAVLGTDAFRRSSVRSAPAITVGVSIESGLLELSVLSKGLTPDELLGVLESYRERKKYYRLKSGEFVGLAGAEGLSDIDRMMTEMDLSAEDVINGRAKLPAYRALYLDKLLERHEALAADRDRTYRALIKNFRNIRDADYEIPKAEAQILRPYQAYGYKWLKTLSAAGFGGILADEMGLGKTLQIITLIMSMKEEGELDAPALVICPASLVYNWQEEFGRFAPDIDAVAVAGNLAARKKLLKCLSGTDDRRRPDVFITSYDLCRKDLEYYSEVKFSLAVLDEAQYIKNQKAGLTKAVKGINAGRRFALTGTPIENRLSELWSIFDFLMPGFLYSYEEFAGRLETPITKNHDEEATARLRAMVGPFILRRLKTDVLKDLPPKLEEVRYARFDDEQRRVYDGQVVRMKEMILNGAASGEDRIRIFAELMRIRQICCDPSLLFENYKGESAKRSACIDLVKSAIEGGHRMLIFSQFTSMLSLIEEDLSKDGIEFFKLTGQTPKEKRLRMVHEFNTGDVPVFLISLKAGGTGLNLIGADMVIHYDPWWNLAAQNQATDRAHRIGQRNTVMVYRLIVKDSIEEKILDLQEAKRDLADAVLSGDSGSIYTLTDDELLGLLE